MTCKKPISSSSCGQPNEFLPDYVSPPGDTIAETLDLLGMSKARFVHLMERPKEMVDGLLRGEVAITPEIACHLEHLLGVPASFWLNREWQYQEAIINGNNFHL